MGPRTLLYTGKGGVGKTSVAAATARMCARNGLRTLIVSTDRAHSLSQSLGIEVGKSPVQIGELLWGQEIDSQEGIERYWGSTRQWLREVLLEGGAQPIVVEELTVPPGMDELFALLEIKRHFESDDFDVVVVDCAPTGETLRLLSFPEATGWWIERLFPQERQTLALAKSLAGAFMDIPVPNERAVSEIKKLAENLQRIGAILRERDRVSIRLVMSPDRLAVSETVQTFAYMNLYGYLTDAVVVNRIFPDTEGTGYFSEWRRQQAKELERVESAFTPIPILKAPYFEREVAGPEMLDLLAAKLFEEKEPDAILHSEPPAHEVTWEDGRAMLQLRLPGISKADIELKKRGPELMVTVSGQKRTIMLPTSLASHRATGAKFSGDTLQVSLDPNDSSTAARSRSLGAT